MHDPCSHRGSEDEVFAFAKAVEDRWYYQWYLDELPVWGMVGEMLPKQHDHAFSAHGLATGRDYHREGGTLFLPYVYTTRTLVVRYNGNRIVELDFLGDPTSLTPVKPGHVLTFKLNVKWEKTNKSHVERCDRYIDHKFFNSGRGLFLCTSFLALLFLVKAVARLVKKVGSEDRYHHLAVNSHAGAMGEMEDDNLTVEGGVDDESRVSLLGEKTRDGANRTGIG